MDHKEVILSTIAGLAVIAISYVVWKHEATVSAANAQAAADQQQANIDQLNNAIASLPTAASYSAGNGASQQSYYGTSVPDTGSTSLQSPAGYSSDLDKILAAFSTPAPSVSNPTTNGTGNTPITNIVASTFTLPTQLTNYLPTTNH